MIREGIINVNKPKGYTSHDCVNVIRSLTGIKRVGHTGTLDPMAEGVLPVCIGSAARINEYLDLDFKTYRCDVLLGTETDTLDIWGETIHDNSQETVRLIQEGIIDEDAIVGALGEFQGTIRQLPPKYSAIKINGRKLYDYARAGVEVEIEEREVYIRSVKLLGTQLSERSCTFEAVCSKGTYIRSICRDIGQLLGCGATMSGLVRTQSGKFKIEDSVGIETLKSLKQGENIRDEKTGKVISYARAIPEDINKYILSPEFPLAHFGKLILNEDRAKWFCNGGFIDENEGIVTKKPEYHKKTPHIPIRKEFKTAYNVYGQDMDREIFLGVAFFDETLRKYKADKVFCRG